MYLKKQKQLRNGHDYGYLSNKIIMPLHYISTGLSDALGSAYIKKYAWKVWDKRSTLMIDT